jgi:hypothetical protein
LNKLRAEQTPKTAEKEKANSAVKSSGGGNASGKAKPTKVPLNTDHEGIDEFTIISNRKTRSNQPTTKDPEPSAAIS